MDVAWSYYLQKKVDIQLRKDKELIGKYNIKEQENNIINNNCSICGQQRYFCMCSKNLEQMNSKNLEIHIDDS